MFYGILLYLLTKNGSSVIEKLFTPFVSLLGFKSQRAPAYRSRRVCTINVTTDIIWETLTLYDRAPLRLRPLHTLTDELVQNGNKPCNRMYITCCNTVVQATIPGDSTEGMTGILTYIAADRVLRNLKRALLLHSASGKRQQKDYWKPARNSTNRTITVVSNNNRQL